LFLTTGCKKKCESATSPKVIQVAALYSETGDLAYLGRSSEAALQIAIEEANSDFTSRNIPIQFELKVYNTQINPTLAIDAMQSIASSGCKLVIGPQTSAELLAIKPIADSLGILVVSPSSTSSSLSLPNDMIFRYAPGDQIVGEALSNSIYTQGKRALISISRNDLGSLGLNESVSNHFIGLGGEVFTAGIFDGTTSDFSDVLAEVKSRILALSAIYDCEQIGVLTTSFDETILLFNQASTDTVFSSVDWFGGVGFFKNQNLLANEPASQFAANSNFFSPGFSIPMGNETYYAELLTNIYTRSGYQADALTLASYDILKVMANMVAECNGLPMGAQSLQTQFLNASQGFQGTTGTILLNENGDRASGTFDYWGVQSLKGTYQWYFVAKSE
jgi:branched-chain amino acid transport system substrate-binding protein